MLSGKEIKNQIEKGNIVISPFNESQLNPNSYNIKLGPKIKVYELEKENFEWLKSVEKRSDRWYLDMKTSPRIIDRTIPEEGMILIPGILYLGETEEYTETYGFVPCIDGRSSIGRLGIKVHATAGFGDNGFKGKWTLEIEVVHPVKIYAGVEIGQIYYEPIQGDDSMTYSGKYQNQNGVIESRMYKDFDKEDNHVE